MSRFINKKIGSLKRWKARRDLHRQIIENGFPEILWSKGYSRFAEQNGGLRESLGRTEKRWTLRRFLNLYDATGSSYWIPMTSRSKFARESPLDWFAEFILPQIETDFSLLTTDGDTNVPFELNERTYSLILENPKLNFWYSQNLVDSGYHPKLVGVPLGIDLHADRGYGVGWQLYHKFSKIAHRYKNENKKVIADCCLNKNSGSRKELCNLIKNDDRFLTFKRRLDQLDLWRCYSQSKYVLSPEGVGADCHRTWEALYMGASVICKDVGIGSVYRDLPVYQVGSWEELEDPGLLDKVDCFVKGKKDIWDYSPLDLLEFS